MLFRYIMNTMRRSAVTNALFCLLLTLAGALFALSAGLWYSVYRTEQSLDDIITTIAMPDMMAIRRHARDLLESGDYRDMLSIEINGAELTLNYADGRQTITETQWIEYLLPEFIQSELMWEINEKIYSSELLEMDDRRLYGAYVEGLSSVPFLLAGYTDYDAFVENAPQSTASFIVKCTEVIESLRLYVHDESFVIRSYIGRFEVEQEIHLHRGRRATRTVTGYFQYSNPDGSSPIEEGKRYIIAGTNYAQGNMGPTWYSRNDWLLFPSNINMPNALLIDAISFNSDIETVGYFDTFAELPRDVGIAISQMMVFQPDLDVFPMDIRELIPKVDETLGHEGVTWFEIDDSLEDALASEYGQQIEDALSVSRISVNSLQVLTTNDMNSLFRFNQRVHRITEGRALNANDNHAGARVCVISEQLAEENGLSIGDKLPLQLYASELGSLSFLGEEAAWLPSPYHPGLELSAPMEYEIVGIYMGLTQEMRDHSISPNTVIIPASSFDGIEGTPQSRLGQPYEPPLLRAIIIPNGEVDEVKAIIEGISEGYSGFFRYFDQGFLRLVPILENLSFGMSWILALSAVGWAVSLVMFSLFYVGRRKKDMTLLYGLGVSKTKCFAWVFTQCAVVILVAHAIVVAAMLPIYEGILESALSLSTEFTEIYRNFTLSDMNVAGGIRFTLPLDRTPMGLIIAAAGSTVTLLVTSSVIIARATKNRWQSRQEVG